jgi:cobalt-zinc-cadmium efflux system membrane fusion protein
MSRRGAPPRVENTSEKTAEPDAETGRIQLTAEAKEVAGIRVETARLAPMGESLTVPGTVEISPNRGAKITPPISGKVSRILVQLGEVVRAGQPLALLESYEIAQARGAVKQAEASVKQTQASLQIAQVEREQARAGITQAEIEIKQAQTRKTSAETALQRQKELASAGAFSQSPLQAAQSELSESQSALLKAQNELQSQKVVLQRAERLFNEELISRAELEQAQTESRKAQTELERTEARVAITKQALEREQKVFKGDLLNRQALQTAEAEVRIAQGDVQKAQQGLFRAQQDVRRAEKGKMAVHTTLQGAQSALATARDNLYALTGAMPSSEGGFLTLYAPITGTITELRITLGEAVERSTPLFLIENRNTVLVNASVPEKEVARIRVGQSVGVTVPAYPKQIFIGVVQSIAGRVDEKTRSLPVRCLVENPKGNLKPEMFAKVSLGIGKRTPALTVPDTALDEEGGEQYLYVEEQGEYEKRTVKIGRRMEDRAEILSGIKPGERVVIEGLFILKSEANKSQLMESD